MQMVPAAENITGMFFCIPKSGESGRVSRLGGSCNGDDLKEESQYASSYCLSSYYSIFVVRLAIMALLAILIGLLTILTWHITKVYTTKSLDSLAYALRYELLQRPLQRMWSILNSTVETTTTQVKLAEYVISQYIRRSLPGAQDELYEMMRGVTWALFASHKALNAITIEYRNGFVQAFHRDHKSNNTFYIYSDPANYSVGNSYELSSHQQWANQSMHNNLSAIWYHVPIDPSSGEQIGKREPIPADELINIAGPSQVPDGVPSWHVALSKHSLSPVLSAALPVWDPSNQSILAVVGATTALYGVGELMRELVGFHSGHIFLTSQEGYLLATSTNAPLLRNSTSGPKLVMAVDSEDDVIRQGAQWLQRTYSNKFPPSHDVHVEDAILHHRRYYIDSFFLNLKQLPMVGVIIIPREYIMGDADERAFRTLIVLISASVCILILGCVCVLILTNGVSKEMKLRAELISQLEARRRAEASSNYKSQFLANMSHELRTPMAAVVGLLDILICDDCLTNEQYTTVSQIRKSSTALMRLLNNILDLSKVESGKLVLEEAEFDLGRELEGLIDMFSVACINQNLETILDLSDDMPKVVVGDSARVVQIFANLISNSIKFTTSGHIFLRGWCETTNTSGGVEISVLNQQESGTTLRKPEIQRPCQKNVSVRDNKVTLWFEVEDTGCGIDPSKWESIFESFVQADPSTTRTHGGTGLGLCIVRTLVNKMGGDIEVIKKNGPGTRMQLSLLLSPADDAVLHTSTRFKDQDLVVLLALDGCALRSTMSRWLHEKGLTTFQASEWNDITQFLKGLVQIRDPVLEHFNEQPGNEFLIENGLRMDMGTCAFLIVVDVALLDLSTNLWKEQLTWLDSYSGRVKFAWVLNHETSNLVKMELRGKGHLAMVKPLYKTKMMQILEAVAKERDLELQKEDVMMGSSDSSMQECQQECLDVDSAYCHYPSSDDSCKSEVACNSNRVTCICQSVAINSYAVEGTEQEQYMNRSGREMASLNLSRDVNGQRCLEGLRLLLAEDTPVLQRVATIMLEKLGASVFVVGDGLQAVSALKLAGHGKECEEVPNLWDSPPFDLVLMDCQMPKMDGYQATKEIRKLETGTAFHVPIVALTAHAMSSDEAKCLEVGMDAYLTKPIDSKLMVSTILSLTRTP
ncbi:hypothetical protein Droror1_Dr00005196 [Drosera rotundifolia]